MAALVSALMAALVSALAALVSALMPGLYPETAALVSALMAALVSASAALVSALMPVMPAMGFALMAKAHTRGRWPLAARAAPCLRGSRALVRGGKRPLPPLLPERLYFPVFAFSCTW